MNPRHHIDDELLVAHAAGTAPEAVSLLIACHAETCPSCRQMLEALDELGGSYLEETPASDASNVEDLLARTLAVIDDPPPLGPPDEVGAVLPFDVPRVLARYVGNRELRHLIPGVDVIELPVGIGREPARLIRVQAGFAVPAHGHDGFELQMVLAGGYTDEGEDFLPGDAAWHEGGEPHSLQIHDDGDCWVLLVREHPMVPASDEARVLQALTGL